MNHDHTELHPPSPDAEVLTDAELEEVTAGKALNAITRGGGMESWKGWYARLPSKARP